jgi:hypothetical protein
MARSKTKSVARTANPEKVARKAAQRGIRTAQRTVQQRIRGLQREAQRLGRHWAKLASASVAVRAGGTKTVAKAARLAAVKI